MVTGFSMAERVGFEPTEPCGSTDFEFYWVTNLFVYFRGSFVSSRSGRKPAWLLTFSEKVPKTQ